MTQQSLITRLKAVEEALQNGAAALESEACSYKEDFGGCSFFNHTSYEEMIQEAKEAKTALSDLRELIKEAEGIECYGVINSDNDVEYSASYPQACHDHINAALQQDEPDEDAKNWVVRRLFFTALGEKRKKRPARVRIEDPDVPRAERSKP